MNSTEDKSIPTAIEEWSQNVSFVSDHILAIRHLSMFVDKQYGTDVDLMFAVSNVMSTFNELADVIIKRVVPLNERDHHR